MRWSAIGQLALLLATLVAIAVACGSGQARVKDGLPLYYGFFPDSNQTELQLKQLAQEALAEALAIDEVRRLYCQFTNHSLDTPVGNLTRFANSNPTADLHVTTFYCNHGRVSGCADYAQRSAVRAALGARFSLNVTALLLTPRTLGYRAELGSNALAVWANGEGEAAPGLRAHFTIATSPGVAAVQTGLDLLEVANRLGRQLNSSRVLDFQQGRFLLLLHRPVPAVFRASDDGEGGGAGAGAGPSSRLLAAVLATSAWLRRRLSALAE